MVSNVAYRARSHEDKESRRQQLLSAALDLYKKTSYADVKMSAVAESAQVAKGTLFLYFPTKEALFLELLEELLEGWFEALDTRLGAGSGAWAPAKLARTVAASLEGHEPLTRLLTLLQNVLEPNVDIERIRTFKEQLLGRILKSGALLEARLPFLRPGEGARLLLHMHALVTGLRLMADAPPSVDRMMSSGPLSLLRVDFFRELEASLTCLIHGLASR